MDTYTKLINLQSQIDWLKRKVNCLCSASGTTYKVYSAVWSQVNSDSPTAIAVNQSDPNYLGDLVWGRLSGGVYTVTSSGLFTGKTVIFITIGGKSSNYAFPQASVEDVNQIIIRTVDCLTNSPTDLNNNVDSFEHSIQIIVYN